MDQTIQSADDRCTEKQGSLPSVLEQYLDADCDRQARRIAEFIKAHDLLPDPQQLLQVPLAFILLLDAAVRLKWWEKNGFYVPCGNQQLLSTLLFQLAINSLADPSIDPMPIWRTVSYAFAENERYYSYATLGCEINVKNLTIGDLTDRFADFLWTIRPN